MHAANWSPGRQPDVILKHAFLKENVIWICLTKDYCQAGLDHWRPLKYSKAEQEQVNVYEHSGQWKWTQLLPEQPAGIELCWSGIPPLWWPKKLLTFVLILQFQTDHKTILYWLFPQFSTRLLKPTLIKSNWKAKFYCYCSWTFCPTSAPVTIWGTLVASKSGFGCTPQLSHPVMCSMEAVNRTDFWQEQKFFSCIFFMQRRLKSEKLIYAKHPYF